MIANPVDAIGNCRTRTQLARVLDELLKPWYPKSDMMGWASWAAKYNSVPTAKKCAVRMYEKMLERGV